MKKEPVNLEQLGSDEHVMHVHHRKKKTKVDENYKFRHRNIFYRGWMNFIRFISALILIPFNFHVHRVKIVGRKHYRQVRRRGAVIINNHCLPLDCEMIASSLSVFKRVHQCSLQENFDIPYARRMIKWLGTIPIPVEPRAMKKWMDETTKMLEDGFLINITPEAALWPYFRGLRPFKNGAFYFSVKAERPILPVIYLFEKRHTRSKKRYRQYRIIMKVLPPQYGRLDLEFKEREQELKERCFQLMSEEIRSFYPSDDSVQQQIWLTEEDRARSQYVEDEISDKTIEL